ncbi:S8 family serine peptidase [Flavobacteriaceae bacterium SZ-1-7]|uniref:S8 family serine peptidase n=1 Tax=Tamlana sedimenti TaxID=3134126 RepID=UPI003127D8E4
MLKNYLKESLCAVLCMLFVSTGFAQTQKELKKITQDYNTEKLEKLQTRFETTFKAKYNAAIRMANQNGWPIRYKEKGTAYNLKEVVKGKPIYWRTDNANAALSTRTNFLHTGGGLGLDLEGQNMTVHIWEVEGVGLVDHNEYDGIGGENRLSIGDDETALSDHAAHVTGTIIASGFQAAAKGMAPQAYAINYNVINDLGEATTAANNGMLLSNHSYGVDPQNLTGDLSFYIGAYTQDSRDWDELMYNAPYYLQVTSAGNSGDDNTSNTSPLGGNANFDKLTFNATSKNNLVVANGEDASIDVDGSLISVVRNSGSSEGPTDDFRVKPDIMGNGTALYSSFSRRPFSYGTTTGTSMSSPNVCGSLLLLQQHYHNINNKYMKAATLKGLALHTADDTEMTGPDATTGWGLLNAKAAVETISENGFSSWVSEEVLENGETFTIEVESDGISPLMASISWTDMPGAAITNTGIPNDGTPVLVNDLDIRISQSGTAYRPWKLTGVNSNTQADNIVDPYERVDVVGASGTYTIRVTHKGTLVGGSQNFSLIITGLSSNFTFNTQESVQAICSPNEATYSFDYLQTGGGTTNFSLSNVPANATANITPTSLNADGSFDVTFGNLSNVPANTYLIDVIGDDGNETETRSIELRVLHSDFSPYPMNLSYPANGSTTLPSTLSLEWQENLNAENYLVEVSTSPSFSSIDFSGTVSNLEFDLSDLVEETVYYWRVKPSNSCGTGAYSEIFSFQVGTIDCGNNVFNATDFSDANILTTPNDAASVPVTVDTGGLTVNSIETSFEINHTWVNDISIALEGPASIGNADVLLFNSSCNTDTGGQTDSPGDGDNFNVTYSDNGTALYCDDAAIPSISGTVLPLESLSFFSGAAADGIWTLRVFDPNNGDGGDIIAFSVDICVVEAVNSIPNFANNGFNAPLNSTYTFLSSDIEATSTSETALQQTYTIVALPTGGTLEKEAAVLSVGDTFTQDDVNTGKITYKNSNTVAYADSFKVDIKNGANGWLPNQVVNLNSTLSTNEFELANVSIWPNPTKRDINIKLDNLLTNNKVSVNLYDIQGRLINSFEYKVNSKILYKTIELDDIQNGLYLVEIRQDNLKATKRIIINH